MTGPFGIMPSDAGVRPGARRPTWDDAPAALAWVIPARDGFPLAFARVNPSYERLLIEQRKVLRRFPPGERVQPSPHVGRFLVGEEGGRVRGHVVGRLAQERLERLDRQLERGECRGRVV